MQGPVKSADGMGGKRDKIGAYPEKEKSVCNIEFKDFSEAVQIIAHFFNKILFRIGSQPESGIGRTADHPVYTWISDFHTIILAAESQAVLKAYIRNMFKSRDHRDR